jgi:hypothetical protein
MRRIIEATLAAALVAACVDKPEETAIGPVTAAAESATPTPRPGFYAAPNGSPAGDGSWSRPWDLTTALAASPGRVTPGDTVWLRGGTYVGAFESHLTGAPGRLVVVRAFPGEHAVIDGRGATTSSGDMFVVKGDYSAFWGFELENTSASPGRVAESRPTAIANDASHTKYINLVVHDGGVGFFTYGNRFDVEVSGCIFYNNGWQGAGRGGGHAMYVKSDLGPVVLRDNIAFNQFGYGVHAYSGFGKGGLHDIRVIGNTAFNNGSVTRAYRTTDNANILIGGEEPGDDDTLTDNLTYFSPGFGVYNVVVGLGAFANHDIVVRNNLAAGGENPFAIGHWDQLTFDRNVAHGTQAMVRLTDSSRTGYAWQDNTYWRAPAAPAWRYLKRGFPFVVWRDLTGLGYSDHAQPGAPTGPQVFVRTNPYEPGRAHVIVYNWPRVGAVTVDLSQVLAIGLPFEVRSVQALGGPPLVSGTYGGGVITIPMTSVQPPLPIGGSPHSPPVTGPDFDVFLVTSP